MPALNGIHLLLRQTKKEITHRLAPLAQQVPKQKHDTHYAEKLNAYVTAVNAARVRYAPVLEIIANAISALGGKGWDKNNDIVQCWLAFAHTVQALRHNPAKGPASIYVDENNKMISYAAAN